MGSNFTLADKVAMQTKKSYYELSLISSHISSGSNWWV